MKRKLAAERKRLTCQAVDLPHDLVPHPRARQMATVAKHRQAHLRADEIRVRSWHLHGQVFLPETAQFANTWNSPTSWLDRPIYVDVLKRCRDCGRPFLFYANDQRLWYETLGFAPDVDAVRCVPCRKQARHAKARHERYAAAITATRLDAQALRQLVDDTAWLLETGQMRNLAKAGQVKNRAVKAIGDHDGTRRLARLLASAHEAAAMCPGASRSRYWGTT